MQILHFMKKKVSVSLQDERESSDSDSWKGSDSDMGSDLDHEE